jgi:hypothetical protein
MASVLDSSQVKVAGLAVDKPKHIINPASQTALGCDTANPGHAAKLGTQKVNFGNSKIG